MNKLIYSLLIATITFISINSYAISLFGDGMSCGKWIEDRKKDYGVATRTYLLGFISGLALGTNKDYINTIDADSLFVWTDNYCQANPTEKLNTAASLFHIEMVKKRGL
jgi:hypothetical protein